jgi:protoheme IX farnesyltransferase
MNRLRDYLSLTKPGIIFGNLVSVSGGLFLGSQGHPDVRVVLATLRGVGFARGGGCALNNLIDKDIDALMLRTQKRPLPNGRVSDIGALLLGLVLSVSGLFLLWQYANPLASLITLFGLAVYVLLYSLWLKRTIHGTWVGSLSGAVPPLAGYCAASGQLDAAGLILFASFALWQLPHAYAIAVLHLNDYARASIPVLPLVRGVSRIKRDMPLYVAAFTLCAILLSFARYTGWSYLAVTVLLGAAWMRSAWRARNGDDRVWARQSFAWSIAMVMALSLMMSVDYVPPLHDSNAPSSGLMIAFLSLVR